MKTANYLQVAEFRVFLHVLCSLLYLCFLVLTEKASENLGKACKLLGDYFLFPLSFDLVLVKLLSFLIFLVFELWNF